MLGAVQPPIINGPTAWHQLWPAQRLRHASCLAQRGGAHSTQHCSSVHSTAAKLQPLLADVPHMFTGHTAARLHGVSVPGGCADVQVCVQWDALQQLHAQLTSRKLQPGPVSQHGRGQLGFTVHVEGTQVLLYAHLNTVVRMDPGRVQVSDPVSQQQYCCESLLSVRAAAPPDVAAAVDAHLQQLQEQLTADNAQAWCSQETESAWLNKLGSPEETARKVCQDPWLRLGRPLFKHLPQQLSGLRLINLMGSHGTKAVAAAVLGAHATCVDISPVNAAFCAKVAAAAGVQVEFVVADVLHLPPELLKGTYDVALLELGVLHYFLDLAPLLSVVQQLLRPGGRLLLREFHPVSTKLITSKGKKHKVTGNYFSQELVGSRVATSKYAAAAASSSSSSSSSGSGGGGADGGRAPDAVKLRQWGLGEVVTAVCGAGLVLVCLEEEPGVKSDDFGLPKTYTLVAAKPA